MADENARRVERLAKRAKELDNMIMKAAKMQKRIVDEIRQIGIADRPRRQRMTKTPRRPPNIR
jgi:hypothetical protein